MHGLANEHQRRANFKARIDIEMKKIDKKYDDAKRKVDIRGIREAMEQSEEIQKEIDSFLKSCKLF